ncbi:MAG: hypothetical protein HOP21_12405 [Methylotenera sp.]|nr:hypothetical protein [Methylotenera sp.]
MKNFTQGLASLTLLVNQWSLTPLIYNNANDPVPTFVGGNLGQTNQFNDLNSATYIQGAQIGSILRSILELKALFTTSNSAHSTYRWNDPATWPTTTVAPVSSNQ